MANISVFTVLLALVTLSLTFEGCESYGYRYSRFGSRYKTTLATFNTALLPSDIPEFDNRVNILTEQIRQSRDVDIFCLQEVWYADVQKSLYNSLRDKYPYALSAVDLNAEGNSDPACSGTVLGQLGICQATNCLGLSGGTLLGCLILRCDQVFQAASQACLNCLLLSGDNAAICATAPTSRYETTYGLLLLSRKELKNTAVKGFTNDSHFRGFLQASVDELGSILCTHLSSELSPTQWIGPPVVYPLPYSSYAEQQYAEVLTLLETARELESPILIGDFNHGPALPGNITWLFPIHYGVVTAHGFYNPYITKDGRCTWCLDNPIVRASYPYDLLIDLIYITSSSSERVVNVKRIFDTVRTPSGVPLSDHYGVKMTLKNYRKNCAWYDRWYYFCGSPESLPSVDAFPLQQELEKICLPLQT